MKNNTMTKISVAALVLTGFAMAESDNKNNTKNYTQTTELEKKMEGRVSVIKNNLDEKIKSESRDLRRVKIEEIDNVKNLKLKLVSDYDAYMAELKKQSNELKSNRYMIKEFQELQETIVELTILHQKNQKELKEKLNGLADGNYKTRKMIQLEKLIKEQKNVFAKLTNGYNGVKEHHINHKRMLKDKFYVDLENLKRKYHNDNSKLQELFKINVNELAKDVDSRKSDLKLDYWEGK